MTSRQVRTSDDNVAEPREPGPSPQYHDVENIPAAPSRVSTAPTATDVYRVGVKVPPFYAEKPMIWFKQLEGQFKLAGIKSDETKFYHATTYLEPPYVDIVDDLIENPPEKDMYETFKEELIKRLTKSKEKKILQLLMHEELGDRKPTQFLRHLQNLAGPNVPDDFIKTVWSSRLPNSTQTILAAQPSTTLKILADIADRVHDVVPIQTPYRQVASTSRMDEMPYHQVASASSSAAPPPGSAMDFMAKQIMELTKQVSALSAQVRESRSRSISRSRRDQSRRRSSKPRSRSQSNYRRFPICWYHSKFGADAHTCVKPCDYQSENSMGGR